MMRKFKTFGLALVAVFAMSAVVASAALATTGTLTSEGKEVIATAEQTGVHKFTLTGHPVGEGFATTECTVAKFTGTKAAKEGESSVTVHPVYEGCKSFGLSSTITTTGCDYTLNITGTESGGAWPVSTNVVCGAGSSIKIVAQTCEVLVGGQNGLTASSVTNSGGAGTAMDLTLHTNITGITYNVVKDGIGCPLSGTGVSTNGDYVGTTTVKAHQSGSGVAVGVTIH